MLQYKQGVDILSDLGGIDSIAKAQELFKQKLSPEHLRRLGRISCEEALLKVANAIALCDPDAVFINTGSEEDCAKIRKMSLEKGEESELAMALKYPGARNVAHLVAEVADALVDIQYVCYGLGHSLAVDMDKAWAEVHRSNMSKVCDKTGKVEKHPDTGKVQKPAAFSPPDMYSVVLESWRDAPYSE